ncbi:MAG: DnaJ C-terminal domain-containing protein [bacterium]|nr:DnaJ C-terminal domain-containing protein [bacterium]
MAKDYYKILGIDKNASDEEVKKAFRKLAHQHHPDKSGGNEAKFKELNEAYQVLGNKEKRAQYNQFGQTFDGGSPPAGGFRWEDVAGVGGFPGGARWNVNMGGDMGDIFETIFDQFTGGATVRRKRSRGSDIELEAKLSLEEAFHGVGRQASVRTHVSCMACGGAGYDKARGVATCGVCHGTGSVAREVRTIFGSIPHRVACTDCEGSGEKPNAPCTHCKGTGRISGMREVTVSIPVGIEDGQVVKLVGQGEAGERGEASGDLYVAVRVAPHGRFARHGEDLHTNVEVKLGDILRERPVRIVGVDGEMLEVAVPGGHRLENPVRVSGKGMSRFGSPKHRGDLLISLSVRTPKHLSTKAKRLLEELEGEM